MNALQAQKKRARKKFKFGVQVPDNPRHAYLLDKLIGDTQWSDTIEKDLAEINESDIIKGLEKGHLHLLGIRGFHTLLSLTLSSTSGGRP